VPSELPAKGPYLKTQYTGHTFPFYYVSVHYNIIILGCWSPTHDLPSSTMLSTATFVNCVYIL